MKRQFHGINGGDWHQTRQDCLHDLPVVGIHELNKKWSLSALFQPQTCRFLKRVVQGGEDVGKVELEVKAGRGTVYCCNA